VVEGSTHNFEQTSFAVVVQSFDNIIMILSSALFSATIPGGIQLWLCPVTEGAERVGGRAGGWVVGSPADGFLCQDLSP